MYRRFFSAAALVAAALALTACGPEDEDNSSDKGDVSSTASTRSTTPGFRPLTNGLYVSKEIVSSGTDTHSYIRFFEDGTVCVVLSSGSSDDVRRWLNPGDSQEQRTDIPSDCTEPGAYNNGTFKKGTVNFKIIDFGSDGKTFTVGRAKADSKLEDAHMTFSQD